MAATAPEFDKIRGETGTFTADGIQALWTTISQESLDRSNQVRITQDRLEPKVKEITTTATDLNLEGASIVHVTSGTFNVSGFKAPSPGKSRIVVLYNSGAGTVTIKHNATSATANQITATGSADYSVPPNGGTIFVYLASKWKQVI